MAPKGSARPESAATAHDVPALWPSVRKAIATIKPSGMFCRPMASATEAPAFTGAPPSTPSAVPA
ncbi:hypothetical protein D9M68_962050 [compost metagenome]